MKTTEEIIEGLKLRIEELKARSAAYAPTVYQDSKYQLLRMYGSQIAELEAFLIWIESGN